MYEQVGDIRALAVAWGKIAQIHAAQGDVAHGIEIYEKDVLPVSRQLGDRHGIMFDMTNLAQLLRQRDGPGDAERACTLLRESLAFADEIGAPEAAQIRQWLGGC